MPSSRDSASVPPEGSAIDLPDGHAPSAALDVPTLRALAEATWTLVCRADAHGRFNEPQEAWREFTGQAWPEHRATGWLQAVHARDRYLLEAIRRDGPESPGAVCRPIKLWHHASGTYRDVVMQLIPVGDAHLRQWLVAVREEEPAGMRHQLRLSHESLNDADRAKGNFLANVSHELRTPMYGIIGMTELALEEEPSQTVREYLQVAKSSAEVLVRLVNEILDFSKLDSGRFVLETAPFSLERLLEDTIKPFCPVAREKGMELACSIAADVPDELIGDAPRLRQVLTNLLNNALKFSQQGEVLLAVTLEGQSADEANLCIAVSDTGIGIVEADQQRIFAPFTQVDSSSTRRHGGTGLGLTIAYELVRHMGGSLQVSSQPAQGSTFVVRLSLKLQQVSQRTRQQRARDANFADRHVFVVEGNAIHRRILEQLLADWHVHSTSADSDEPYWSQIERTVSSDEPCDALLVDASLRDVDGVALVDKVAGSGWQIPLIQVLPIGEPRRLECSGQHIAFLEKPMSHRSLWESLEEAWNPAARPASGDQVAQASAMRPLHVLLAEDTVANQKIVKRILGKRGHAVDIARNGREVVEMVRTRPFDIILMDVQMPVMDGLQAAQSIRSLEAQVGERIPIVALTAHAMQGDRERCLAAGMDAYLSKPVDTAELIDILETLVAEGRPARPSTTKTVVSDPAGDTVDRPCFDLQAALKRLGGDRALLGSLIGFFLEDSPGLIDQLRAGVQAGNAQAVEHAAHSLKGLVANFDAHDAVRSAARIEKAGHDQDVATAGEVLSTLAREVAQLRVALETHVSDENGSGLTKSPGE